MQEKVQASPAQPQSAKFIIGQTGSKESFRIRQVNSNLAANVTANPAVPQNEYQSIFNAYNSPPLKLRQSGMLEKKIPTTADPGNKETFSQYMQH